MTEKKLRERLFSWKLGKKTFVIHRMTDGALRFRIDYRDRRKTTLPTYVQWFDCLENTISNYPELEESSEANEKYMEGKKTPELTGIRYSQQRIIDNNEANDG